MAHGIIFLWVILEWEKKMMELKKNNKEEEKPRSESEGLHGHIKENMMFGFCVILHWEFNGGKITLVD